MVQFFKFSSPPSAVLPIIVTVAVASLQPTTNAQRETERYGYNITWSAEEGWPYAPSFAGDLGSSMIEVSAKNLRRCARICERNNAGGGSYGYGHDPNLCLCYFALECLEVETPLSEGVVVFSSLPPPKPCERSYCDVFGLEDVEFCSFSEPSEYPSGMPSGMPSQVPSTNPSTEATLPPQMYSTLPTTFGTHSDFDATQMPFIVDMSTIASTILPANPSTVPVTSSASVDRTAYSSTSSTSSPSFGDEEEALTLKKSVEGDETSETVTPTLLTRTADLSQLTIAVGMKIPQIYLESSQSNKQNLQVNVEKRATEYLSSYLELWLMQKWESSSTFTPEDVQVTLDMKEENARRRRNRRRLGKDRPGHRSVTQAETDVVIVRSFEGQVMVKAKDVENDEERLSDALDKALSNLDSLVRQGLEGDAESDFIEYVVERENSLEGGVGVLTYVTSVQVASSSDVFDESGGGNAQPTVPTNDLSNDPPRPAQNPSGFGKVELGDGQRIRHGARFALIAGTILVSFIFGLLVGWVCLNMCRWARKADKALFRKVSSSRSDESRGTNINLSNQFGSSPAGEPVSRGRGHERRAAPQINWEEMQLADGPHGEQHKIMEKRPPPTVLDSDAYGNNGHAQSFSDLAARRSPKNEQRGGFHPQTDPQFHSLIPRDNVGQNPERPVLDPRYQHSIAPQIPRLTPLRTGAEAQLGSGAIHEHPISPQFPQLSPLPTAGEKQQWTAEIPFRREPVTSDAPSDEENLRYLSPHGVPSHEATSPRGPGMTSPSSQQNYPSGILLQADGTSPHSSNPEPIRPWNKESVYNQPSPHHGASALDNSNDSPRQKDNAYAAPPPLFPHGLIPDTVVMGDFDESNFSNPHSFRDEPEENSAAGGSSAKRVDVENDLELFPVELVQANFAGGAFVAHLSRVIMDSPEQNREDFFDSHESDSQERNDDGIRNILNQDHQREAMQHAFSEASTSEEGAYFEEVSSKGSSSEGSSSEDSSERSLSNVESSSSSEVEKEPYMLLEEQPGEISQIHRHFFMQSHIDGTLSNSKDTSEDEKSVSSSRSDGAEKDIKANAKRGVCSPSINSDTSQGVNSGSNDIGESDDGENSRDDVEYDSTVLQDEKESKLGNTSDSSSRVEVTSSEHSCGNEEEDVRDITNNDVLREEKKNVEARDEIAESKNDVHVISSISGSDSEPEIIVSTSRKNGLDSGLSGSVQNMKTSTGSINKESTLTSQEAESFELRELLEEANQEFEKNKVEEKAPFAKLGGQKHVQRSLQEKESFTPIEELLGNLSEGENRSEDSKDSKDNVNDAMVQNKEGDSKPEDEEEDSVKMSENIDALLHNVIGRKGGNDEESIAKPELENQEEIDKDKEHRSKVKEGGLEVSSMEKINTDKPPLVVRTEKELLYYSELEELEVNVPLEEQIDMLLDDMSTKIEERRKLGKPVTGTQERKEVTSRQRMVSLQEEDSIQEKARQVEKDSENQKKFGGIRPMASEMQVDKDSENQKEFGGGARGIRSMAAEMDGLLKNILGNVGEELEASEKIFVGSGNEDHGMGVQGVVLSNEQQSEIKEFDNNRANEPRSTRKADVGWEEDNSTIATEDFDSLRTELRRSNLSPKDGFSQVYSKKTKRSLSNRRKRLVSLTPEDLADGNNSAKKDGPGTGLNLSPSNDGTSVRTGDSASFRGPAKQMSMSFDDMSTFDDERLDEILRFDRYESTLAGAISEVENERDDEEDNTTPDKSDSNRVASLVQNREQVWSPVGDFDEENSWHDAAFRDDQNSVESREDFDGTFIDQEEDEDHQRTEAVQEKRQEEEESYDFHKESSEFDQQSQREDEERKTQQHNQKERQNQNHHQHTWDRVTSKGEKASKKVVHQLKSAIGSGRTGVKSPESTSPRHTHKVEISTFWR